MWIKKSRTAFLFKKVCWQIKIPVVPKMCLWVQLKNKVLYFSIKLNFIKFEDSPLLLDNKLITLWGYIFLLISELVMVMAWQILKFGNPMLVP